MPSGVLVLLEHANGKLLPIGRELLGLAASPARGATAPTLKAVG